VVAWVGEKPHAAFSLPPPVLHDRMHHLATQLGLMEEMTSAMLNPPTSLSIPQHPSTLGYSIIFVDLLHVLCITLEP